MDESARKLKAPFMFSHYQKSLCFFVRLFFECLVLVSWYLVFQRLRPMLLRLLYLCRVNAVCTVTDGMPSCRNLAKADRCRTTEKMQVPGPLPPLDLEMEVLEMWGTNTCIQLGDDCVHGRPFGLIIDGNEALLCTMGPCTRWRMFYCSYLRALMSLQRASVRIDWNSSLANAVPCLD